MVVIAIGLGVYLFASNYNLRAGLTGSKYRRYSYTNDASTFKLLFYKDSKQEVDPTTSGSNSIAIVSPANAAGILPMQLIISKAQSSVSSTTISQLENCDAQSKTLMMTKAFTVYIPSASHEVNVCSLVVTGFNTNLYVAAFSDSKSQSVYSVTIGVSFDASKLSSTSYTQQLNSEIAPITPYQNDIKTILGSISN